MPKSANNGTTKVFANHDQQRRTGKVLMVTTDEVQPLVSLKVVKLPPAVTVTTARVDTSLKMLASMNEIYLDVWPHRAWLGGGKKPPDQQRR